MFETSTEKQLLLSQALLDTLEALNSAYGVHAAMCVRYNQPEALERPLVSNYASCDDFFRDYQCYALLAKSPYFGDTAKRADTALKKFYQAENQCAEANKRLQHISQIPLALSSVLVEARRIASSILHAAPTELTAFRFGPGATTSLRAAKAVLANKVAALPEVSVGCLPFLAHLSDQNGRYYAPSSAEGFFCIRNSNVFTTVPKDYRGDRGICIEPDGNMIVQLSLGSIIRRRLKACGWDLDELQFHHTALAQRASIDGRFATIDLSSASDTVSRSIVRHVMPPDWYALLNRMRSPSTEMPDGTLHENEKFSSMGNGFTFELETLIFLCICLATMHLSKSRLKRENYRYTAGIPGNGTLTLKECSLSTHSCSVYGDDIIVPTECAAEIISNLEFFGFKTNIDKTFVDGPFRESCGGDFYNGVPVRPIFIKEFADGAEGLYALHNRLYEVNELHYLNSRACKRVTSAIAVRSRFYGPPGAGDFHLASSDKSLYITKTHGGLYRVLGLVFSPHPKYRVRPPTIADCHMFYALLGGDSNGSYARNTRRCSRVRYVTLIRKNCIT